MANPETGEGFDAPTPTEAYAGAPELRREMRAVMELGVIRDGCRDGSSTRRPPGPSPAAGGPSTGSAC
jgi:hypothetical protein